MGRAIDMEKDIYMLKMKVEMLENTVRGMTHTKDEIDEKASKTKKVELDDDEKTEEEDVKKETDNKASSNSGKRSNAKNRNSKGKTDSDGGSSK